MLSAIVTRIIILVFGVLYPAYESFRAIRARCLKAYVKWIAYWIVFALFTSIQSVTDQFVTWIPFYYEMKILAVLWLVSPATHGSSIFYKKVVHRVLQACENDIDNYITSVGARLYNFIWRLGSSGTMFTLSVFLKGHNVLIEQLKKMYEAHNDNSDRSRRSRAEAEHNTDSDDEQQDETLIEADDERYTTEMSTRWSRLPASVAAVTTSTAAATSRVSDVTGSRAAPQAAATSRVSDVTGSRAAPQVVGVASPPRQPNTASPTSAIEDLRSTSLSSTSGSYFDKYVQPQPHGTASMSSTSANISTTLPSALSYRTSSSPTTSAGISTTLPASSSRSSTYTSPYRATSASVSTTSASLSSRHASSSPTTSASVSTTLPSSTSTTSSASLSYYERYIASRSSTTRTTSSNYTAHK